MKPDITVVVAWVKEAWDSIPPEMVKKSFLKCGISNAMDCSEDNLLYEDDNETAAENETVDDADDDDEYTADIEVTKETIRLTVWQFG